MQFKCLDPAHASQEIFAPQLPVAGESGEPLQMQGANDSPRKTISIHSQTLKTMLNPEPQIQPQPHCIAHCLCPSLLDRNSDRIPSIWTTQLKKQSWLNMPKTRALMMQSLSTPTSSISARRPWESIFTRTRIIIAIPSS